MVCIWSIKSFLTILLATILFAGSSLAQQKTPTPDAGKPAADSAQESDQNWKREPDQEPPEQAKGEAQEPDTGASAGDLAKAAQNPIASLISVPLQNNSALDAGQFNRTQNVLNIQPVIPVRISENWNLISRIIQPIVWQPFPAPQTTGGEFGFGDMNPTFFFSPAKPSKLIWGAGPAFVLPTATNTILGEGKFSIGPGLVVLTTPGHWVIGVLVNNVWSVAGDSSRPDVNQMLIQYFANYNLKKGWYIVTAPILTADWEASSSNRWVVPLGGGVGRVMRLGHQPVNLTAQFYGNAVYPAGGSPWGMRLQIQFLYPKKPKK
jgi:hypothetical protein